MLCLYKAYISNSLLWVVLIIIFIIVLQVHARIHTISGIHILVDTVGPLYGNAKVWDGTKCPHLFKVATVVGSTVQLTVRSIL